MTVSRSGQTLRPCTQMSSAVLATTVTSASLATPGSRPSRMPCRRPRRNFAPPIPPDRTVIRRSGRHGISLSGTPAHTRPGLDFWG